MARRSRFDRPTVVAVRSLQSLEPGMSREYAYTILWRYGVDAVTAAVVRRHVEGKYYIPIERYLEQAEEVAS